MIDNETPVLRKEDLIDILEALFKFSQEPNNAFVRKEDGLFVLDFYQAFQNHISDTTVHTTNQETDILKILLLLMMSYVIKASLLSLSLHKKKIMLSLLNQMVFI